MITEAMAAGLPVVATDIAGIPEQVVDAETGLLVPTGDPEAVAESLDELLSDPERRNQFGTRARERVNRFSGDRMCADLDSLYRELLARNQ